MLRKSQARPQHRDDDAKQMPRAKSDTSCCGAVVAARLTISCAADLTHMYMYAIAWARAYSDRGSGQHEVVLESSEAGSGPFSRRAVPKVDAALFSSDQVEA